MKSIYLFLIFLSTNIFGQNTTSTIQMISDRTANNPELQDYFYFEGIDFYDVKFIDKGCI